MLRVITKVQTVDIDTSIVHYYEFLFLAVKYSSEARTCIPLPTRDDILSSSALRSHRANPRKSSAFTSLASVRAAKWRCILTKTLKFGHICVYFGSIRMYVLIHSGSSKYFLIVIQADSQRFVFKSIGNRSKQSDKFPFLDRRAIVPV